MRASTDRDRLSACCSNSLNLAKIEKFLKLKSDDGGCYDSNEAGFMQEGAGPANQAWLARLPPSTAAGHFDLLSGWLILQRKIIFLCPCRTKQES